MGWTLSSGWAEEKRSCKRACEAVLSQPIAASAANRPKNLSYFPNCGHLSRRIPQKADCPQFKILFGLYQWFNSLGQYPPLAA